jgi:hypothetical protein
MSVLCHAVTIVYNFEFCGSLSIKVYVLHGLYEKVYKDFKNILVIIIANWKSLSASDLADRRVMMK